MRDEIKTEPRINFVVQAQPGASYLEVNRQLNKEIDRVKVEYLGQFGDEPVETVILIDDYGTGPRGYVTRGVLYHKLRGKA
jgi:hypothetical protein